MSIITEHQSASPNQKVTGPKHHIYPNTSPPKRPYFTGAPTPDMTPESSVANDSLKVSEAKAPPPLDLPLHLSLTRSRESHHGSPTVSPSPSTEPSMSSSEAVPPNNQSSDSTRDTTRASSPDFRNLLRRSLVFGPGQALPFSIQEEDEPETSASCYSTNSEPNPNQQKKKFVASSLTVASKDSARPNVSGKTLKERSFRKRVRRFFRGRRDGFKGGDRIQF